MSPKLQPLSATEAATLLTDLPGWTITDGMLTKAYDTNGWPFTMLVVGAIGLILFKNRSYKVNVWLFGLTDETRPINVVWVMLATAAGTLTVWWLVSLGRGLVRDYREVRREREAARAQELTQRKVSELDNRQRKIEEQFQKAAGAEAPADEADADF